MLDEEVTVRTVYKEIYNALKENQTLTDVCLLRGFVGKIEINIAPSHKIGNVKFEYTINEKN